MLWNILALYGVQAANYLLPLVAMPYVARVLRPDAWGIVVLAQALAVWLTIIVEYGFIFSATREVARVRQDTEAVQQVVAGVFGAKTILVIVMTGVTLVAFMVLPAFQKNPEILFWTWLLALGQGTSGLWYFQGIEQIRVAAGIETVCRLFSVVIIFLFVKHPQDTFVVVSAQALMTVVSSSTLGLLLYKRISFQIPNWADTRDVLKAGSSMFFYRLCVGLYTTANALILGGLSNSKQVGYYGSAERIVTAANAVYWPFWRAIYPRINYELGKDKKVASRLAVLGLKLVVVYGVVVAVAVSSTAPLLIQFLLGNGYESTTKILQILIWIVPFVGISGALGLQWMVPNGMERQFNFFTLLTAVLNIALSFFLTSKFAAVGMAVSVLIVEIFIASIIAVYLWKNKRFLM